MTIPAITGLGGASGIAGANSAVGPNLTANTSGASFSSILSGAIDNVQSTQATANDLAVKAVTGDLTDIHQATIAATRAQVTVELVTAVRNKGVDAFNEMMRMQA
ncbi:flagellar hook-basal body complex protein FliE [Galbitalea soli]|uniref:Flagellar hook-basal body complex protein FliE n=1 Tax=Galbitalea soli TaxID=1268042 RepID=A0A7C9PMU7_9MICO|nr:flagellar hook-basal body complex protein FliE [Galbitalea soli]NEM91172.1 flagellar hook-basal body complex protein FliE [Galbitalea soli]NYJ29861.1 flagellar hook-basal body complex protein FliE [Galbitalea soli]